MFLNGGEVFGCKPTIVNGMEIIKFTKEWKPRNLENLIWHGDDQNSNGECNE